MATGIWRYLCKRIGVGLGALLLLMELSAWPTAVLAQSVTRDELLKQAAACEKNHDWRQACCLYDELLRHRRDDAYLRQAYQRCLRRYRIVQRHQDQLYRTALERLRPAQALDLYVHVLETIDRVYTDRQKSSPAALFAQGLEELHFALEEPIFLREYFPAVEPDKLVAFQKKLLQWRQRKITHRSEAREQVGIISRAAQQLCPGGKPSLLTVIPLEFLSGACNALDEYTFFLTPGPYREVQAALRGRLVSIGVELEVVGEHLEIRRVYPHSPAEEAGLMPRDRIVRIEGQSAQELTIERAAELLCGPSGTSVKLEVVPCDQMDAGPIPLEVRRAPVVVPSVEYEMLDKPFEFDLAGGMKVLFPIGRLTIHYFQESTFQEVKEALATLQAAGMKVLILDLRHNPGGLFKAAIEVAELFLPEGIIVISQTRAIKDRKWSGSIRVDRRDGDLAGQDHIDVLFMPMVVLIDGETASAAEVLAGALKDNGRAKLLGQPSFGKGTLQCVIPLDKPYFEQMPAGIRITVARLLSPTWQPYSGKGIEPHFRSPLEGNDLFLEARQLLLEELRKSLQTTTH